MVTKQAPNKKLNKDFMEAIEFITDVENGKITIPKKYASNLPQQLRVIILVDTKKEKKTAKKKVTFSAFKVKSKGFKFNRDEANER